MTSGDGTRVFLSAGEVSGDHYGAEILQILRQRLPGAEFTGLGGTAMEAAGQRRVVRAEDVAVMGITEILRHVPRIYTSYRRLVRSIQTSTPQVAVLIDFPDVNFRLAKHLRRRGVPVIWFVSPQLWAWKRRRLRWVQQRVDRMMVIFPFEPRFYAARGVAAEFVGHPLAELSPPGETRAAYAERNELDAEAVWVALLPGSRWREVVANLPAMIAAAALLARSGKEPMQFILPVAGGLDRATVEKMVEQLSAAAAVRPVVRLVPEAFPALSFARASVVASGTATVLAAVAGQPFVVVYRVSRLTFGLAKRLVAYPEEITAERDAEGTLPVAMVNLIAGRRVVPELLNDRFTAAAIADAVAVLLPDGPEREAQQSGLEEVRELLRSPAAEKATGTARVAAAVLELLKVPAEG